LKGITGKNINQLVRKIRVRKAAELLKTGKYNVTEVSFMVGINSAIYFRQCFKEEFGMLPSAYQKSENLSSRSEEHTSELQSREKLVCRLLLEKKKTLGTWLGVLLAS